MSKHAEWLREVAKQAAAQAYNGWGNTCLDAADHIESRDTEIATLRSQLSAARRR